MLNYVQAVTCYNKNIFAVTIIRFVAEALQLFLNKTLKLVLILLKSKYGFKKINAGIKGIFIIH